MSFPQRPVMSLGEVAAYLGVHPSTVYRMLKNKKLRAFKLGRDWRFMKETVDAWLKAQEEAGNADTTTTERPTP
jgi:excisionase family DNA binding protein